jgi:TM2 domain-containing membrane protein YozV
MANRQTPFARVGNVPNAQPSKRWTIAAALALAGALNPLPIPLTGIHKFYLGQPIWGGIYLLLGWTQIPRIACAMEGVWFLTRAHRTELSEPAPPTTPDGVAVSQQTQAIATALRELEKLRQEGLISEHEFEQNRRRLLERLH